MLVPRGVKRESPRLPIRVGLFGATGSIGRSALEVVRAHPETFSVTCLVARSSIEELAALAREFKPRFVGISDVSRAPELRRALAGSRIEIVTGDIECAELAGHSDIEVVLAAIVGGAGLRSVIQAASAGKRIALANKESLVCGGELVSRLAAEHGAMILPVDSEHSAIFQALQGESAQEIERLVLTASGGPFLRRSLSELSQVTVEEALHHPRWKMGPKVTIDSSTMCNKALELIEAHWLFGIAVDSIDVVVHPQSIVHSLVAFVDGTQIAQLSRPDMRGPIAYALHYPYGRLERVMPSLRLEEVGSLEFLPLDGNKFPAVELARACVRKGGIAPLVFTTLNEIAVEWFLRGRIPWREIVSFIEREIPRFDGLCGESIESLLEYEAEIRGRYARQDEI